MHRCALAAEQKRVELTQVGEYERYKEERDVLEEEKQANRRM